MVLDKNSQGYREEYDGAALNKMADMAKRYVEGDDGNRYVRDSISASTGWTSAPSVAATIWITPPA